MAKVIIDTFGTKRYFNDNSQIHREDGPAIIHTTGAKSWIINGNYGNSGGIYMYTYDGMWLIGVPGDGMKYLHPNGLTQQRSNGSYVWPLLK